MLKWILDNSKWVLNNKGIAPWLIAGGIGLGSKLLGHYLDKDEDEAPTYYVDPYVQKLRDIYQPRLEPSYYDIPETGVETATSEKLLGRLGRGVSDIKPTLGPEAAEPYYQAAKARMGERFGEEEAYVKDVLQREGVLTSTPGTQSLIDLKRKQGQELEEFSQRLMYEDIQKDIEATKMAEDIVSQTISQATLLGGQQRQALQWPYLMSQQALGGAAGLRGEGVLPTEEESLLSELGGGAMDIGQMLLLMELLKGQGGGKV